MKLVFSGGWLGQEGLYQAQIKRVRTLRSLQEIELKQSFLIVSYHVGAQTLQLPLRKPLYPPILQVEIGEVSSFRGRSEDKARLRLLSSSFTERDFIACVERVKEMIQEGTFYQLNLTCRFDFELSGSPMELFVAYYRRQPVPYAFFLELEDFYLVSGSMELFLEKRGRRLLSKPIKGTATSLRTLSQSVKDKAENLMITDMVRNDLSKVALPGSVRVEELFRIEKFKTLYQMHSSVVAETQEELPALLEATFPPASVVGAPKRKAVEVIDQLEPHLREYYCGCAGFLLGGDFTLSVLIRTAIGRGRELSYYAGAGILWDSVPEKEWQEVLLKVRAFHRRVGALQSTT